jgi:hypothetical protein
MVIQLPSLLNVCSHGYSEQQLHQKIDELISIQVFLKPTLSLFFACFHYFIALLLLHSTFLHHYNSHYLLSFSHSGSMWHTGGCH